MRRRGHQVILFSENLNYVHPWFKYDVAVKLYATPDGDFVYDQIRQAVKTLDHMIDVYHIHNEPDWLVNVVRSVTDKPIVYDIHDMKSIREYVVDEWEEKAFKDCDAFSVVSKRYKDLVKERSNKPVEEVLSCVNKEFYPLNRCKLQHNGIVYEGGLKGSQPQTEKWREFDCRYWAPTFNDILKTGTPVWAYRGNTVSDVSEYGNFGTMIMGPLPYHALVNNLTAFEAGLVGSPQPDPMFDGALPNKLFEYIAAGLPILAWNAGDSVNEFILATGTGAVLDNLEEIPDVLNEFKKMNMRDHVWSLRHYWSMDSQGEKVENLYKKITEEPSIRKSNGKEENAHSSY